MRTGRGSRCGRMTLAVVVLNRSLDVRPVCHCSIRQVACVGAKFTVVVGQLASSTRGPTPLRRQASSVREGAADRPVRGGDGYAFVIGAQDAGGGPLPGPDRPRARKHGRMAGRAFGPPLVPIRPAGRLLHGPRWEARSPSSGASAQRSRPLFGGGVAVPYASGAMPSRSAPCRCPYSSIRPAGPETGPEGPVPAHRTDGDACDPSTGPAVGFTARCRGPLSPPRTHVSRGRPRPYSRRPR